MVATITGTYGGPYKPDPSGAIISYNRAEHLSQAVADTPPEFLDLGPASTARRCPRPPATNLSMRARRAVESEDGWLPG